MAGLDEAAGRGDVEKVKRTNLLLTSIVAVSYGLIVFLCTYVAQDAMSALVNNMPEWLTHGLSVAGGILPAIGFGMLLNVMMKLRYIPYFIAGFLAACYINMSNLLPVALMGTAFAIYDFYNARQQKQTVEKVIEENADQAGKGAQHVGI